MLGGAGLVVWAGSWRDEMTLAVLSRLRQLQFGCYSADSYRMVGSVGSLAAATVRFGC